MSECNIALFLGMILGACLVVMAVGVYRMWQDHKYGKRLREIAEQEAWTEWRETR